MKKITLSGDERLIERARLFAEARHETLNDMFCNWLGQITGPVGDVREFDALMKRLMHVQAGRPFRRDEMNES
jgi:hypothetical protein